MNDGIADEFTVDEKPLLSFAAELGKFVVAGFLAVADFVVSDEFDDAGFILGTASLGANDFKPEPLRLLCPS